MSSSSERIVTFAFLLALFTLVGVIYGTLEVSDNERSAWAVLQDLLIGKITLLDLFGNKGARCAGPDKNASYEYDQDGKCKFIGCKPGYYDKNGVCVEDKQVSEDCTIDGYTYGECQVKLNETCGPGAGTQLKTPNVTLGAIGAGSCESASYVDCNIPCPDVCRVPDDAYSTPEGVGCMASTPGGESVKLGEESGYCGQGTLRRDIIPEQISQSVLDAAGYSNIDEYLAYANPNGVCPTSISTTCEVECKDGLLDVGCDYGQRQYEYIKDSSGAAICFNKAQADDYIAGVRTTRPDKLNTILAADVKREDGTYDVEGKIPESERNGVFIKYLSDQGMSYDNISKNDCTLFKTEACEAPREDVDCVIGDLEVSDCISPGCGEQMYQSVTRGVTVQPFGDGKACETDYASVISRVDPTICGTSIACCKESDYKPDNVCKSDGKMTYTLNDDRCNSSDLASSKEVDCYYAGEWKLDPDMSECMYRNGKYVQRYIRDVKNPLLAQSGTDTKSVKYLETDACAAVDCKGSWSGWSECSKSCDTGIRTKTWTTSPGGEAKYGGEACPSSELSEACNTTRCCTDNDYERGGAPCKSDGKATYTLNTNFCVQNDLPTTKEVDCCYRSDWKDVDGDDGCKESGSIWKRKQTRDVVNASLCGSNKSTSRLVNDPSCDPVPCQGSWSGWGECSKSCGPGEKTRTWTTTAEPLRGGESCPSTESKYCYEQRCCTNDDYKQGANASCNSSGKITYELDTSDCGKNGLADTKELDCCYQSDWSSVQGYDACKLEAGEWKRKQTRTVVNGRLCDDSSTTRYESTGDCNRDCSVSGWKNYPSYDPKSQCTKSCGSGTYKQYRTVTVDKMGTGAACPKLEQEVDCNTAPCPVNCEGSWKQDGNPYKVWVNNKNRSSCDPYRMHTDYVYEVTRAGNSTGTQCEASNGDKKTEKGEQKQDSKGAACYGGH